MTMSSRPRVLTEQDAGSMDTLIRRGEQAATAAEQTTQQLQGAAADLEQVKGTIPAAAQSAAALATAQAKATLDAATLNATTAASQATLALATLPKFRSVDVNNPTAPTQAELDANPGGLGGTRLTADGATQLLRWTPHTLAGAWVTVGAPTATAPQVQEARDLAQQADGRAVDAQALAEQADSKADSASDLAAQAQAALGNLTRATLAARTLADGPQLADGSRWVGRADGVANGGTAFGTIVEASEGGVWAREFTGPAMQSWFMNTSATPAQNLTGLRALMGFKSVHFDIQSICTVASVPERMDITGYTITSASGARLEFTGYADITRSSWQMTGSDFTATFPECGHAEFYPLLAPMVQARLGATPLAPRNSDDFYRQVVEQLTDAELYQHRRIVNCLELEEVTRFRATMQVRGSLGCGPFVVDAYDGVLDMRGMGTLADVCSIVSYHPESAEPHISTRGKLHVQMLGEYGGDDMSLLRYYPLAELEAELGRPATLAEKIAASADPPPRWKRMRNIIAKCINRHGRARGICAMGLGAGCRIEMVVEAVAAAGLVSVPDENGINVVSGDGAHIYGSIKDAGTYGPEPKTSSPGVWVDRCPNLTVDVEIQAGYRGVHQLFTRGGHYQYRVASPGHEGLLLEDVQHSEINFTVDNSGCGAVRLTGDHDGVKLRGRFSRPGAAFSGVVVEGGQRLDMQVTGARSNGDPGSKLVYLSGVQSGFWRVEGYGGEVLQFGGNVVPLGVNGQPYFAPDFVDYAPQMPDMGRGVGADAAGVIVNAPEGKRIWNGSAWVLVGAQNA